MKNKFVLLTLILTNLICNYSNAQEWASSNYLEATEINPKTSILDNSGNLYTLSEFKNTIYSSSETIISYGDYDLLISKFDNNGTLIWNKQIGNVQKDISGGLSIDSDNNIYISGTFLDDVKFTENDSLIARGGYDFYISSFTEDGMFRWARNLSSATTLESSKDIEVDVNGDIVISGFFKDSLIIGTTNKDTLIGSATIQNFIAKVNQLGELLWVKFIEGNYGTSRVGNVKTLNNGYIFGGYFTGSLSSTDFSINSVTSIYDNFVFKTDLDGNVQWIRRIYGTGSEVFKGIELDEYENIYILGNYESSQLSIDSTSTEVTTINQNIGGWDTYIGKYNRSGVLQWIITKGSSEKDIYEDLSIKNNIIYATGYFGGEIIFNNDTLQVEGVNNEDAFIAAFNSIGDPISGLSIKGDGSYSDGGISVETDPNARAVVTGYFKSPSITMGDSVFTNSNPGKNNLFVGRYSHPFKAAFTNENYISCSGQSDGMLTVTPYFGVPPYTYNWTKDGSPIAEADSVANGLDAGLYRVSVTDSRDSVATTQVQFNDPATLTIGYSVTEVSCYNGSNGGINLTVTGGNNNYQYNWAGGTGLSPTSGDQTGLIAADYSVTVTDIKGCTASQTITVSQPVPITFGESVVISTNADADTGRVDLVPAGGTEPYAEFSWEGPDGYVSIKDSIDCLHGGNYSVTVTDANSCMADTMFLVPNDSVFIGYMTDVNDVTCSDLTNGSAIVSSNRHSIHSSFKYVWIDLEDSVQIGSDTNNISGLDSSDYRVYIIDLIKKDTIFVDFEIFKPEMLELNSGASNPICYGSSDGFINATASGGTSPYSYNWSNGSTNEDLSNVQAGTYTLTVTDANNCTATTSEILSAPDMMSVSIDKTDPLCNGENTGLATANVSGGISPYNYKWDDPGFQTNSVAGNLYPGIYGVAVTDQNGCTTISSVTLNNPAPVSMGAIDSYDISCFGADDGSIKVTPSGGSGSYTYDWSHIGSGTDSVGNLAPGDYTVTVNDVNDCTPIISLTTINEPAEIIVDIDTVDNICFGENNGQITVAPAGGSGSFDYTWGHTTDNTETLTNLSGGIYNLTLSDGSCPDLTYNIPVDEPAEIIVSVDTTDISCLNAGDGQIALFTTGGTGNYTYTWSPDATTEDTIAIITGGTYTVSISDDACPDIVLNIPVNEPDAFIADIDTSDVSCYNITDGIITVTPSGGSENYSYTWSHTTDNVNQVTGLSYGSYDVTISDGSCPDITANVFVDQPEPLVFDIDTTDVSCEGYSDGSITVDITGGSGNYTYTWGHTSLNISQLGGLSGGTYNLTVSDGACPDSALVIPVNEPEELLVGVNKQNLTCYNAGDGSVQLNISGGSESYDITWGHTSAKEASLADLDAGNYNVTVNDGNCPIIAQSVEITEPGELLIAGYDSVNLSAVGAGDGQIIVHATGGTEPYRYSINSSIHQLDSVFNNLDAGKYKIEIDDANNCGPVETDSIEIKEPTSGVVNYWEGSAISYYPNPADEKVTIEINDLKTNSINLKVINSMGSLLINREVEVPDRQNILELETGYLSPGVYFILIDNMKLKTPLIIE